MRKTTLVLVNSVALWLTVAAILVGSRPAAGAGAFGAVIPLPGHISEILLDEPRSLLYAANFTAGRVDVISTSTNRLISTFNLGGVISGIALSPDGRYMVTTNYNNYVPGQTSSITVVNLADLTRQNFAISNPPLAVAFGGDGVALIVTTVDLQRFRPNGGTFELVTTIASLAEVLPVPEPRFPREITRASMTASGDGNYVFGITDSFVFVYQVPAPSGVLYVRPNATFCPLPSPPLVSAAYDGSYFMAGQFLLDRRLRVMAKHVDTDGNVNIGGHVIDFGLKTIYSSFPESITTTTGTGEQATTTTTQFPPKLNVQDADNLTVRDRFNLPERVTGRMVLAGGGRRVYAVSDSGVTYLPLTDLATLPQVRPGVEQLLFQFDFCQQTPLRQQFRIEGNTDFEITSSLKGITFSPSRGTAPATIEVTVDFAAFSRVQGTTAGNVVITSQNALNVIKPVQLDINVKDVDQRGRIVPVPGRLVDLLADPKRDQFYVLEQTKNELHVFQNSDLRLLGTFRTGNRPTWMGLTADRRYLLITNSAGENLTVINLDTMRNEGYLFTPWGDFPVSVAADNGTILTAAGCVSPFHLDWVEITHRAVFTLDRLGVYKNEIDPQTAMVPLADMSGIFIAESDGRVKWWEAASQRAIVVRQDFESLSGAIAAGPTSLVVGNNILNTSLVPQAQLSDAPNQAAGFVFVGDAAVRTTAPGGTITDAGAVHRLDVNKPKTDVSPVRMVEAPSLPSTFPFLRSLAALRNGKFVSLASSGLVELPSDFDAGIAMPQVRAIASAADFSDSLAAGSLVSIFGKNLAPETKSASSLPLPTTLANVCVTVNGLRLPLLYVSPGQINGQLPFDLVGRISTVLHTPGGLSDIYYAEVKRAAPAVFQVGVAGQSGSFPAVVRTRNNQLATLSNPVHPNETILIYASGLGEVGPPVEPGFPGPVSPLAVNRTPPRVTLGGVEAPLYFAGLAPGFVGVYQLNVKVPGDAPLGLQIPLSISTDGSTTTVNLRVVD